MEPAEAMLSPARRLTPVQYRNAVEDLFGGRITAGSFDVVNVSLGSSGYSTDPGANPPNAAAVEQLYFAAETAAVQSVPVMQDLLPCSASPGNEIGCVDQFIDTYVLRAFRRPADRSERDAFHASYQAARSEGFSVPEAFAVLVHELLQSAPFLYVIETGTGTPQDGRVALTDYEVATRLAFLFRDSIPDQALLDAAAAGRLRDKDELARQARRLLDTYPDRLVSRFAREWLHLDGSLDKDRATFPEFTPELEASFEEELTRLLRRALTEPGSFSDTVLTAREVPVDARLAARYGVSGFTPGPDGWAWVELAERYQGLLARPYILSSWAGVRDSSPVQRGVAIMTQILCAPPGTPPPNADTLEPDYPPQATARQKSELLRASNAACASCHDQIDNIGLALENYDALGGFRDLTPSYEGSQPIDASGHFAELGSLGQTDLAGTSFTGAQELARALAESDDLRTCLSRQWFRYAAHHRETTEQDLRLVAEIRRRFREGGETLASLFIAVTQSDAFLHREISP